MRPSGSQWPAACGPPDVAVRYSSGVRGAPNHGTFPKARQITFGDFIDRDVLNGNPFRALSTTDIDFGVDAKSFEGRRSHACKSDPSGSREGLGLLADEPAMAKPIVALRGATEKANAGSIRQSLQEVEAILQQDYQEEKELWQAK